MLKNSISAELLQETEAQAMLDFDTFKSHFPFLVDLQPEERKRLSKMSLKKQDFIDKVVIHAAQRPDLMPQYLEFAEFEKDVQLTQAMERFYAKLKPLSDMMKNTLMLLRSESYEASRAFYKAVKDASQHGAEGTEKILNDLAFHFKRGTYKDKPEETETTTGITPTEPAAVTAPVK